MTVRTFEGRTIAEVMTRLKRELGREAIILETRTVHRCSRPGGRPRPFVQVTATKDPVLPPKAREDHWEKGHADSSEDSAVLRSYQALVQQSVAETLAQELVQKARQLAADRPGDFPAKLRAALRELITGSIPAVRPVQLQPTPPTIVACVGPTGVGKTTTIAKLAAHFGLREQKRVAVITLDTHRLGAVAQLERYAHFLDLHFAAALNGPQLAAAIADAPQPDLVLIDTPGIPPGQTAALAELQETLEHAPLNETHLVLSATSSAQHLRSAATAYERFSPQRVLLTKLDEAVGFGVVLSLFEQVQAELSYVTTGTSIADDLHVVAPTTLGQMILGEPVALEPS